jgi:hypothetical protein
MSCCGSSASRSIVGWKSSSVGNSISLNPPPDCNIGLIPEMTAG